MPVAVRRKSWEEHVTHRTGLQYSFDDLDILCCHGIAQDGCQSASDVSKPGRRGRCASLPECCRELRADRYPFTEAQVSSEDADANFTLPEPSDITPKEGSTETLVFEPDGNSIDGARDSSSTEPDQIGPLETGASGNYRPSTETPGEASDVRDCGPEDRLDTSDQPARSKHEEGPMQAIGSPKKSSDEAATPPAFVDSQQGGSAERLDPSPCEATDAQATGTLGNISGDDAIPIEAGSHLEASLSRRTELSPGTVEASLKTAMEQCTNAISEGEMISARPLSGARQVVECNGADSDIGMIREDPDSVTTDSRETDFDKSTFTVDLVHEVPCDEGVGCQNSQENQMKPLGESTNATSNMDLISEVPQAGRSSSETGEAQIEAKYYAHKEEESIVKLRKRKGSKEERERSHLDSMILLIMKLDQLDQDIENALSATSSISNTPTLKRRNGNDPEAMNEDDTFHSTHQQKMVPHMICSALSSPGTTTSPGEKARTGVGDVTKVTTTVIASHGPLLSLRALEKH